MNVETLLMAKTGSVLTEGKLYDDVVFVDSPDDADMEVLYDKIEYDFERVVVYATWVSCRNRKGYVMGKKLTQKKAKKILKHGSVKGHKLTKKQKGFFGARAGGAPVRRKKR
jgi:hypothetical protein